LDRVGELMLLVFTRDGANMGGRRRAKAGSSREDLIANGTAETFEATRQLHSSKQRHRPSVERLFKRATADGEQFGS
jgi:hypothetical protein